MCRWRKLAFILIFAVVIASLSSHLIVWRLKIKASWGGRHHYGLSDQRVLTILHGSSVAYSGIDWQKVARALDTPIESWASPGSTPSEWEQMHLRSPEISRTFIVVSPVDLNEHSLCDFRAEIVPLDQTIRDLWQIEANWPFSKKVLSQYPIRVVRTLFPTVGRSDGVMTGVRDQLKKFAQMGNGEEEREGFRFDAAGASALEERVSDWSPGRLQRRMVLARAQNQGKHSFNGLKKVAVTRLIQKARQQGEVTWIVLPVSPLYQNEFLTSAVIQNFEMALVDLKRSCPSAKLIRLDQLSRLQNNDLFTDFVHMNRFGQKIATAVFLSELENNRNQP